MIPVSLRRARTWHELAPVAAHLAAHGADEEEILRALRLDAAARGIEAPDRVLDALAVRAAGLRNGPCDCLEGPVPPAARAKRQRVGEQFVRVPVDLLDWWYPQLPEAERAVLLYIVRRTVGFERERDAISLAQFVAGAHSADGTPLDGGTGLCRRSVITGLAGLLARRLITAERQRSDRAGDLPTLYGLNPARPRIHRIGGSAADAHGRAADAPPPHRRQSNAHG